jgi:hypothetical protein
MCVYVREAKRDGDLPEMLGLETYIPCSVMGLYSLAASVIFGRLLRAAMGRRSWRCRIRIRVAIAIS